METIKDSQVLDIDIYNNEFEMYLQDFCASEGIKDFKSEPNNVWCACMMYIYNHTFKNNPKLLKDNNLYINNNNRIKTNNNRYNHELLNNIADIFIINCIKYNKDISIYAYSLLIGIDMDILYTWNNKDVTDMRYKIYKKLHIGREQCLTNKLADGKQNPVGVIAILNHSYNWQTTATAQGITNKAQSIDALPVLQEVNQIERRNP